MNCPKCKYDNNNIATYCSNCGQKIIEKEPEDYNIPVKNISIFFFTLVAYIGIFRLSKYGDTYASQLVADSIFALIVIIFFILNYKTIIRLFNFKLFSLKVLLLIFLITPLVALAVHSLANFLNNSVFEKSHDIYCNQYKDSPAPMLLCILSIGAFPAIFEELAFRGILFNESLKIMRIKPTILVTSILFTILHFSLLSALWLFPGALLLGYLRAKYKTLFYGILVHFLYNTCIVLFEILLS